MGILRRAGEFVGINVREAPSTAGFEANVRPPSRATSDNSVNLDRALTLPAVFRSVQMLSTAIAQLDLRVERGGATLDRVPALIAQPDVDQTLSQFLKRTVIGLAGTGNAYWLIIRNDSGMVSSLQVLDPLQVSISRSRTGAKIYNYGDKEYGANKVKHLRLLEVPGHDEGLGPIQACRQGLYGSLTLRDYSDHWFGNGSVPTGVLTSTSQLTPEEADAYKRRWHELQQTRDVAVLGQGLSYEPIILKPGDAQFLESQEFGVTDIARMFGVPSSYLLAEVNGSTLVYTNSRDVDYQFAKYTLMAYLKEIEDAFTSLLVRGQVAKFDLDGFLRPDPKAQAEIYEKYLSLNVISAAEVREALGFTGPPPRVPKPVAPPPPPPVPSPTTEEETPSVES